MSGFDIVFACIIKLIAQLLWYIQRWWRSSFFHFIQSLDAKISLTSFGLYLQCNKTQFKKSHFQVNFHPAFVRLIPSINSIQCFFFFFLHVYFRKFLLNLIFDVIFELRLNCIFFRRLIFLSIYLLLAKALNIHL